jgi:ribosomal protein S18 acetylase RimI-like enzyme
MNIALMPLSPALHVGALQHLYRATPSYWQRHQYTNVPAGQAANDMRSATETPGRYLMGVVQPSSTSKSTASESTVDVDAQPIKPDNSDSAPGKTGGELIGLVDFRLDWPEAGVVYVGMVMIAEREQRLGLGTAAWQLLRPWLANNAQMHRARLGVEQFNPTALKFFESLGFQLTGEANRIKVGEQLVRLLYMELML